MYMCLYANKVVQDMNKPKIVFIVNSIQKQRCIKRIQEFVDNGYAVSAYGFSRKSIIQNQSKDFSIEIIGEFPNSMSYWRRLQLMIRGIYKVIRKHRQESVVFYYFGLDIALLSTFMNKKPYIYEESDLAHTYIKNKFLYNILEKYDKKIVLKSFETAFTSEGFYKYHFGNTKYDNISIIPNKINKQVSDLHTHVKKKIDISKLVIAFVGGARFNSIYNFSKVYAENFPQHELHFFGNPTSLHDKFESLKNYSNVFFHGPFRNPDDLPVIYSKIDMVLSAYDVEFDNVRYAEPNKIYESIYFRTPIIVSKGTFLSDKVSHLNIGFSIDPFNEEEIISFVNGLTLDSIESKLLSLRSIPNEEAIDSNDEFFHKIENRYNNI